MSLAEVLDSIATQLKVLVPVLRLSEVVGGEFNPEELRRQSVKLPGAFVTCSKTEPGEVYGNKVKIPARFLVVLAVAFKMDGQPASQGRERLIARLATRVIHKVMTAAKKWDNDEVLSAPERVASKNLYSRTVDSNGVALWAVWWDQQLLLNEDPPPGALDDFLSLKADYQLVESGQPTNPQIDATDIIKPNG